VSDQDRRALLRLLDAMDDHYDQRISDQQFVRRAAATRDSLHEAAKDTAGLAKSVRALEGFLSGVTGDRLPVDLYGNLRIALADLE